MKLYEIQEPDITKDANSNDIAVGIDLGTTNSLIAISEGNNVSIIPDDGIFYTPSIVAYVEGEVVVGKKALAHTGAYISSIKRLMGKSKHDIPHNFPYNIEDHEGLLKIKLGTQILTPIEISAEILKSLKAKAEKHLDRKVTKAVITVPAYFDDAARQATKDAAILAGIEVLRLLNEPTAAAVAYGLDQAREGIYAIYDLGGGTFDVSILKMQQGVFQVLATSGDTYLGGDDFDELIVEYLANKYNLHITDPLTAKLEAKQIKESLTANSEWKGEFIETQNCSITKADFEKLIEPLLKKTIQIFTNALKDAEVKAHELKETILVGGASRIPLIKEMLSKLTGKPPLDTINPDQIVAIGAAVQASTLSIGGDNLLIDVVPLSLGIEVANGLVEKIIFRNTPIPILRKQIFTTQATGQTGIKIHVVQGEGEDITKCRSLAHFELKGLEKLPAGEARIEVSFQVDADGILTVSAYDIATKTKKEVQVKPSYGLNEQEMQKLLQKA